MNINLHYVVSKRKQNFFFKPTSLVDSDPSVVDADKRNISGLPLHLDNRIFRRESVCWLINFQHRSAYKISRFIKSVSTDYRKDDRNQNPPQKSITLHG